MRRLRAKDWWHFALAMLPFWAAFNASVGQYRYINGAFRPIPFSVENAGIGFVVGIIFAVVLWGIGLATLAVIGKVRAGRPSNHG